MKVNHESHDMSFSKSDSSSRWMVFLFIASVIFFTKGEGYASGNASSSEQVVQVKLGEWGLIIDQPVLKSGKVTFKAANVGTVLHEMVVIKTDLPADQFKVEAGKVKEDAVGEAMGEIEGFSPESKETLTLNLSKGSYVLFCNNQEKGESTGHYQKGMRISIRVD